MKGNKERLQKKRHGPTMADMMGPQEGSALAGRLIQR